MPASQRSSKRDTLNIRIKPEVRGLIDRAAHIAGKTRTDFVLDAAKKAAEDTLLDRTIIPVPPKVFSELLVRFDAPAQPNERLRGTLQKSAPWE